MSDENKAIESVLRDYIEGWYSGDASRMKRAIHPSLAKRGYHLIEKTNRTNLVHVGASNMIEYTRAGLGKLDPDIDPQISIEILEAGEHIAIAKATSIKFIDHIQLAKCNDQWQIVNVLWEANQE